MVRLCSALELERGRGGADEANEDGAEHLGLGVRQRAELEQRKGVEGELEHDGRLVELGQETALERQPDVVETWWRLASSAESETAVGDE